jgi:hypothetical protein
MLELIRRDYKHNAARERATGQVKSFGGSCEDKLRGAYSVFPNPVPHHPPRDSGSTSARPHQVLRLDDTLSDCRVTRCHSRGLSA